MSTNSSDIDELIAKLNTVFSNSNRSVVTNNSNTMAVPKPVEYQLLRLYVDTIPHYDGNPNTLNVFVDNCENLISTFSDSNNPALNGFIFRAIIGRLTGRALALIGPRTELNTWADVKNLLTQSFSDQRNIDCLEQDLIVLRPFKNETPYNFGMRCQDARSLIISKINSLPQGRDKAIKIENYNKLALRTFIRGLPHFIQNNVRLRDPDTLEKAMSLVIEEENFLYSQNRSNNLNSQNNYKPIQKNLPTNFRQPQTGRFQYNPNSPQKQHVSNFPQTAPQFSNVHQLQSFPRFQNTPQSNYYRGPMQGKPMWQPNTNFPTQKHPYFQQKQYQASQIRPQNTNQNRTYKPEPMDTSSTRFTKQTPRQQFQVQELYAQDISEFENPFENNQNYCEGASALPPSAYNVPENYEDYSHDQNYETLTSYDNLNSDYDYNISNGSQLKQNEYSFPDNSDVNFHQDTTLNNPT